VDADGGSCKSTLILNEKVDINQVEDFAPIEMNVRFFN
jgi:hypothetical protein